MLSLHNKVWRKLDILKHRCIFISKRSLETAVALNNWQVFNKKVNKNILLFYLIAERFLDQHDLFYGDNFFTDVLFWSFSVFKTIIYSILKSVTKWCPLRIYQVNLMWTFRLRENSLRLKCKTWDFYEFNIFFLKYYVKTKT